MPMDTQGRDPHMDHTRLAGLGLAVTILAAGCSATVGQAKPNLAYAHDSRLPAPVIGWHDSRLPETASRYFGLRRSAPASAAAAEARARSAMAAASTGSSLAGSSVPQGRGP